jgi:hypothetical protein
MRGRIKIILWPALGSGPRLVDHLRLQCIVTAMERPQYVAADRRKSQLLFRVLCACEPSLLSITDGTCISRTERYSNVVRILRPFNFSFRICVRVRVRARVRPFASVVILLYSYMIRCESLNNPPKFFQNTTTGPIWIILGATAAIGALLYRTVPYFKICLLCWDICRIRGAYASNKVITWKAYLPLKLTPHSTVRIGIVTVIFTRCGS